MLKKTIIACYVLILAAGVYATRGIDSETGTPRNTPKSTPTFVARDAICPADSTLKIFEDGSGACYRDDTGAIATDYDGIKFTWPENTFAWDCHTMGNKRCG